MSQRTIIVINDVCDENGRAKQQARCHSLLGQVPVFVGVRDDIEASGEIIDQFANLKGAPGLIIAQSAPRTTETNKTNGTGFCYFWHEDTLFITSVKGRILSLVKKLGLVANVNLIKSDEAIDQVGVVNERDSQFRSLEWLYAFAQHLLSGQDLPHEKVSINEFPDASVFVWHIDKWQGHDKWGNCKLSLTEDEVVDQSEIQIKGQTIPLYNSLKDVPEGGLGVVRFGSSGLRGRRFLEVSVGNGNASQKLNLSVGDEVC